MVVASSWWVACFVSLSWHTRRMLFKIRCCIFQLSAPAKRPNFVCYNLAVFPPFLSSLALDFERMWCHPHNFSARHSTIAAEARSLSAKDGDTDAHNLFSQMAISPRGACGQHYIPYLHHYQCHREILRLRPSEWQWWIQHGLVIEQSPKEQAYKKDVGRGCAWDTWNSVTRTKNVRSRKAKGRLCTAVDPQLFWSLGYYQLNTCYM